MGTAMAKCGKMDGSFEIVFATGNLPSNADLGLQQESGMNDLFKMISLNKPFISPRFEYHCRKYQSYALHVPFSRHSSRCLFHDLKKL